jgi:hypothetical protein
MGSPLNAKAFRLSYDICYAFRNEAYFDIAKLSTIIDRKLVGVQPLDRFLG